MITFNGEPKPYVGEYKLISNTGDLGINQKDSFPIYVKVEWKNDNTSVCPHIIITRIERR
jgi:hypothetical protein